MKNKRLLRVGSIAVLALWLVVLGLIGVYSEEAMASNPGSTKTFDLKYAGVLPKGNALAVVPEWWSKEVEKRTGGKVKVTLYHAQALGKGMDYPEMLKGGAMDLASLTNYHPSFPMLQVFDLPFVAPNRAVAMDTFYMLYYKGLLEQELQDYKVLWWQPVDPIFVCLRNKKVVNAEQFKGLKVRGQPGPKTEFVKELGATGISMPTPEVYMALDRGIIDGLTTTPEFFSQGKLYEVAKYWIWEPLCTGGNVVAMNLKLWKSLPTDIKLIVEQLSAEARYRMVDMAFKTPEESRKELQELGAEVYSLSEEERARWHEAGQRVVDEWLRKNEGKGLPASQVLEESKWVAKSYQ